MNNQKGRKFWWALVIFGLLGQVAWVVENMYFNVFIYKIFHASAAQISLMVSASAVSAAVTTIFMGALSDRIGKRKLLICGGYVIWGLSILAFALIRMDVLTPIAGSAAAAAALGVNLVIIMDCVMTFFGSTANDAAFNAWMTDWGNDGNRGRIEGVNAMMPLVAIIVVFGGFMALDLEQADSWTVIFTVIGLMVFAIGVGGFFLMEDVPNLQKDPSYFRTVFYSFRPSVVKENLLLYVVLFAFAVFGISIQIFMPYLILYYEKSLGMANYVLVMAPAIILASVVTAFYGKLYDMLGFKSSVMPALFLLMGGYVILYFGRGTGIVFVGSLLMMIGYLAGMAVFGAMIRDNIPDGKSGQFQGVRIIGQVLIPGIIGPAVGAWVLRNADTVVNSDGTTSFLPNENIFLAALVAAAVLAAVLWGIFAMMRRGHYDLVSEAGEKPSDWTEYPRPQMRRSSYQSLCGTWELNGSPIRVPYPPQSALSGYGKKVGKNLVYKTSFRLELREAEKRTLLHFGAVDQVAEVLVNGVSLGTHEGGYLPFCFDVTEVLTEGENKLEVRVTDTLSHVYPYGKQRKDRGGMWYTPVSGIWQAVWLEQVPQNHITSLEITPNLTGVEIKINAVGGGDARVRVQLPDGGVLEQTLREGRGTVTLPKDALRLWTPDSPYLYDMTVHYGDDTVETYFALRTVEIGDVGGVQRVLLNGKPVFLNGVLDQGYFCDGIFLPASPSEYERDVLRMKALGINLLRKHIKIEPACFYYACDRLGMLVMQDMVNCGDYSFLRDTALPTIGMKKLDDTKCRTLKGQKVFFEAHMTETQKYLYSFPSVISYTIFNEGWGQFESDRMYRIAKENDPTRLYDATSGWFWQNESDFDSHHVYFGTEKPQPEKRPMLLSEFGGYTMAVEGHIYAKYASYGYGAAKDKSELTEQICVRYRELVLPVIPQGCCGCIYTQVSDVEDEINGFYTYDRKVCKVDQQKMRELAEKMNTTLAEAVS